MTLHHRIPSLLLLLVLVASSLTVLPTAAAASPTAERDFARLLAQERADRGLHPLAVVDDLSRAARQHSRRMADRAHLHHNPDLASQVNNWQRITENVGVGPSSGTVHRALMGSTGHRANILDTRVTQVGIGVEIRNGRVWVTQVFRLPTGVTPPSGSPAATIPGFRDVLASATHARDISRLSDARITAGCASDRFCPTRGVTRAEMASFLTRAMSLPRPSTNRYRDVGSTNVHRADINAIAAAGITRGCNPPANDRFCPDRQVTREEMASFLVRAQNLPRSSTDPFRDVRRDNPHRADIAALRRARVTAGCNPPTNDRYCPSQQVTREQMASFLVRAFGL